MELDLLDKKLLAALDLDARQSTAQLAKKVHVHRNVALYRIKKLEEAGVIHGSYAEINYYALGYTSYRVFVKLGSATLADEQAFIESVKQEPRVIWFFKMAGAWDFDIVFLAKNAVEFYEFYEPYLLAHNRIIADKRIAILIQFRHYPRDYLLHDARTEVKDKRFDLSRVHVLDEPERQILDAIARHADAPVTDLAERSGLSVNTVKAKLASFKKDGIIMGFRPLIDTEKAGYHYYRLHLNIKGYDEKQLRALISFLEINPWMVYLDTYLGGDDLELEMHVPGENALLDYVDAVKEKFGAIILSHSILKFSKEYVFRYLPAV